MAASDRPNPQYFRSMGIGLALILGLSVAGGCGSSESTNLSPTVPVTGKVTWNGKPLAQGTVTFEPDGGREAHADIQPDGSFTLTTFTKDDGALQGTHRVAVTGSLPGGRDRVPLRFQNYNSSQLEVEVVDGKTDYTLDLR